MGVILLLVVIALGYLFYWHWTMYTDIYGAPYVPMEADCVERILEMAEVGENDVFYDLGSGDGRLVIGAAMRGAKAIGIETDWFRVLYSRFWIALLRLGRKAKIVHGDIFKKDLSDATVVCTYLLQRTNNKLQEKLEKELKKGTKVVSAAFIYKGWKLLKKDLRGTQYGPLYVYEII